MTPAGAASSTTPTRDQMARDVGILVLAMASAFLLAGPSGNFPLLDDWSFAAPVDGLIRHGRFEPTGWTAMTLLTQTLWGALFSIAGGFSFDTLRFSSVVAAFVAAGAGYALLRELDQPRQLCRLLAYTLAFTPIFFALSATFMTDVPFIALMLLASIAFCRHLRTGSRTAWTAALLLSVAAILMRQLALVLPLAFALASIIDRRHRRWPWWTTVLPLLLGLACYAIYRGSMQAAGILPAAADLQAGWLLAALKTPDTVGVFLRNSHVALVYLGWFLLPVLLILAARLRAASRRMFDPAAAIGTIIVGALAMLTRARDGSHPMRMPLADNILVPAGIGPPLLRDQYLLRLDNLPPLPDGFWITVTVLGLIGAVLLLACAATAIARLLASWRGDRWTAPDACAVLLLLAAAIYLAAFLLTAFFDRYLLPAVPLLAVGIAATGRHGDIVRSAPAAPRFAATLVLATALFSIAGTHDLMAWNRLRWQVLDELMHSRALTPRDIDGGFEFNGYHLYDPAYAPVEGKSSWWVDRDDYLIGFGPTPGFTIIEQHRFQSWLWMRPLPLVVLQKQIPGG